MKKLIIVRHGHDIDDRISATGRAQILRLSQALSPLVEIDGKVLVLTSIAPRGIDTANLIAEQFSLPVEPHEVFWSENSHREDFNAALALIDKRADDVEILIVVTHYEYVKDFPKFYGDKRFGKHSIPSKLIEKGQAWIIDLVEKSAMVFG